MNPERLYEIAEELTLIEDCKDIDNETLAKYHGLLKLFPLLTIYDLLDYRRRIIEEERRV